MSYIYLIQCADFDYYKVGISDNPTERLASLQTANPHPLRLVALCCVYSRLEAQRVESETHRNLSKYSVHSEWSQLPKGVVAQLTIDMAYANKE